jgi:hypothetical protein
VVFAPPIVIVTEQEDVALLEFVMNVIIWMPLFQHCLIQRIAHLVIRAAILVLDQIQINVRVVLMVTIWLLTAVVKLVTRTAKLVTLVMKADVPVVMILNN